MDALKDENDKPWRKPGADITDYFNYGFNEETWIAYCLKQKRLRSEHVNVANKPPGVGGGPMPINTGGGAPLINQIPTTLQSNVANNMNNPILATPPGLPPNPQFIHKIPQNQFQRPMMGGGPPQMGGMQQQQQQQRKMSQIDVIGSTDSTSRRPQYELEPNMQNPIAVVGGGNAL